MTRVPTLKIILMTRFLKLMIFLLARRVPKVSDDLNDT